MPATSRMLAASHCLAMSRLLPRCRPPRLAVLGPLPASRRRSSTMQPRSSTMQPRSSTTQPRFSPGTDVAALEPDLTPLLAASGGRWTLAADGQALERSFRFKTFAKTWDFMTAVALQCKIKSHHPEWSNTFNTTFVRWTTHETQSLSDKDVRMAAMCDAIAKDFGELPPEPAAPAASELADRARAAAGDCCTRK